jgi:hypothetical protein
MTTPAACFGCDVGVCGQTRQGPREKGTLKGTDPVSRTTSRVGGHIGLVLLQRLVVRPKPFGHEVAELGRAEARVLAQKAAPGGQQRLHVAGPERRVRLPMAILGSDRLVGISRRDTWQ